MPAMPHAKRIGLTADVFTVLFDDDAELRRLSESYAFTIDTPDRLDALFKSKWIAASIRPLENDELLPSRVVQFDLAWFGDSRCAGRRNGGNEELSVVLFTLSRRYVSAAKQYLDNHATSYQVMGEVADLPALRWIVQRHSGCALAPDFLAGFLSGGKHACRLHSTPAGVATLGMFVDPECLEATEADLLFRLVEAAVCRE